MRVSVAIATYNRAGEVEKTLAGLSGLDTTGCADHEILVVDNNSKDETRATVERWLPRFGGRLRYVREERQGLSHARNRAIDAAAYEVVAYLDDDVDVDPRWLRSLCDAYASGDVAGVGGRAYLVYPGPKPRWLGEPIEGLLTRVELGPERRPAGVGELFGVNLSFRKDWLRRAGGFRTDIGRIGTTLFGGEDDDMIERVAALGGTILYEPAAVVGHRVPPARLSRKWFWNRCFWGHVSAPRLWPDPQVSGYELLRSIWHAGRSAGRTAWAGLRHGPRSAVCFQHLLTTASRSGICVGLIGELRRRSRLLRRGRPAGLSPLGTASR
jgi:glycosyltransferase involved in cell wall biosynthesis